MVDSAFSITPFEDSHIKLTLNAPFEAGTMSSEGVTTSRINAQDHIVPQTFFPSIVTIKDPTKAGFLYVLNNMLRTKHYGAQTTRTGRMRNMVLGVAFADGEITSNLRLTQAAYDLLSKRNQMSSPDPIQEEHVVKVINDAMSGLIKEDGVAYELLQSEGLQNLLDELRAMTEDEAKLKQLLKGVNGEANDYASKYINPKRKANRSER